MSAASNTRRYLAGLIALCVAVTITSGAALAAADAGGIYTLNQERLYAQSAYGRRVSQEIKARQTKIKAENKKLEAELKAEELKLTKEHPSIKPKKFRKLADAFDAKVQKIRRGQAIKGKELSDWATSQKRQFFRQAFPVLLKLAKNLNAAVIIDERFTVISSKAADITNRAIARMNVAIGTGLKPATGKPAPKPASAEPAPAPRPIKP